MLFINTVCTALDRNRIRYAVVGGYAVALHGAVRGTMDVDIVVNWDLRTLRYTENALSELGLVPRLPITADDVFQFRDEYIRNRNLIAWNFHHPEDMSQQVDIIISYDLKGKKRHLLETPDGPIRLLNIEELIDMKRESGRPQDLEDVKALERCK